MDRCLIQALFELNLPQPDLLKAGEELRKEGLATLADLAQIMDTLDRFYEEQSDLAQLREAPPAEKQRPRAPRKADRTAAECKRETPVPSQAKATASASGSSSSSRGHSSGSSGATPQAQRPGSPAAALAPERRAVDEATLEVWRAEAAQLGCRLIRIPCRLAACLGCGKARLVDARAPEAWLRQFRCGDAIQVNQELVCDQEDEATAASAYVLEELRKYVR